MKKEEIENQIEDLKKSLAELERQEKIEEEKRRREEEEAKGFWHEMTIRVKVYKKRDIDTNYYIMLNDLFFGFNQITIISNNSNLFLHQNL